MEQLRLMKERGVLPDKRKIRNLKQYRDISDEEFEEKFSDVLSSATTMRGLEERIEKKLEDMAQDYDMEDMKVNDKVQLRALAQAEIQLEDLETTAYVLRQEIADTNVLVLEKVNNIMSKLRSDISMISNDLQLTRRIRKQSKEASVISYIDTLREKARKFYKQKMLYVFCPECRMLLATTWLMYPDSNNSLKTKCGQCGHAFTLDLAPLYETENRNLKDVEIA
jgi:hypothetical protein